MLLFVFRSGAIMELLSVGGRGKVIVNRPVGRGKVIVNRPVGRGKVIVNRPVGPKLGEWCSYQDFSFQISLGGYGNDSVRHSNRTWLEQESPDWFP